MSDVTMIPSCRRLTAHPLFAKLGCRLISAAQSNGGPPVTTNLFTFVDLYSRGLTTLAHVLDKGAAFARSKGATEAEMLEWRLIDDMNPLRFQAYSVINFSRQLPARVAGLE